MTVERTTVAADADDLAVLRDEARRRGVPLSRVLRDAVTREADAIRDTRRPRFGIGRSATGAPRASARHPDEPYDAHPARS